MHRTQTGSHSLSRSLLAGILSALLLGGCGYTLVPTDSLTQENDLPVLEEAEPILSQEEVLRDQLLSVLNLDRQIDDRIFSSSSVDEAASFLLEIVLQNPEQYAGTLEGQQALKDLSSDSSSVYLYDGELSSTRVGSQVLPTLNKDIAARKELYYKVYSLGVAHGESALGSLWLILIQYADMETP